MKINYKSWNPKQETLKLVWVAEEIIEEYEEAGYTLTLRQLYYQFVSRDLIPNTEKSYKNLGAAITKARMAGMIDWDAIEDRNREYHSYWTEENQAQLISDLPGYIRYDQWARQETYIEVWVEKEALGNVVAQACDPYLVPHMACKGYLSASEAWRAGRRFKEQADNGKDCILLHLGDHDPSGIDMTRDNADRLELFSEHWGIEVNRLALNMDQIEEYDPPPNPAKITDTRAKKYISKYGATSWELDALEPRVIETLIRDNISRHIDGDIWESVTGDERHTRLTLGKLSTHWEAVENLLKDLD